MSAMIIRRTTADAQLDAAWIAEWLKRGLKDTGTELVNASDVQRYEDRDGWFVNYRVHIKPRYEKADGAA